MCVLCKGKYYKISNTLNFYVKIASKTKVVIFIINLIEEIERKQ